MNSNYLCVTVPIDLICYQRTSNYLNEENLDYEYSADIEIIRNNLGQIESVNYYENSEISKSVIYKGSSIIENKYYKYGVLYLVEEIVSNRVSSKMFYKKDGNLLYKIEYKYNKLGKITSIKKNENNNEYEIIYGYDELDRINNRKIYINMLLVNEQKYRYDILNRIVEYRDLNQMVSIQQMNSSGELISYKITDKIGNEITVKNAFLQGRYSGTKVSVNGYCTDIVDESYVDNVMLKKPYTNEDDLDLIISRLLNSTPKTHRACSEKHHDDTVNAVIENNILNNIENRTLPISIRKRLLFNIA